MKDQYHYIEAYLKDRMTPQDRITFEKAMLEDPDLKEAVENYPLIEPFLDLLMEEDARKTLNQIQSKNTSQIKPRGWWKMAATILLVCVAGTGIWQTTINSSQHLYTEFVGQRPMGLGSRGDTPSQDAGQSIQDAYDLMKQNDLAGAEKILHELTSSESPSKRQSAEWYLIMLSLKAGDEEQAIKMLEEFLNNDPGEYREDAQALHKRLTGFLGLF